jgi:hypothetical protein
VFGFLFALLLIVPPAPGDDVDGTSPFREVRRLYGDGDYGQALSQLAKLSATEGKLSPLLLSLWKARCANKLGRAAEAKLALVDVVNQDPAVELSNKEAPELRELFIKIQAEQTGLVVVHTKNSRGGDTVEIDGTPTAQRQLRLTKGQHNATLRDSSGRLLDRKSFSISTVSSPVELTLIGAPAQETSSPDTAPAVSTRSASTLAEPVLFLGAHLEPRLSLPVARATMPLGLDLYYRTFHASLIGFFANKQSAAEKMASFGLGLRVGADIPVGSRLFIAPGLELASVFEPKPPWALTAHLRLGIELPWQLRASIGAGWLTQLRPLPYTSWFEVLGTLQLAWRFWGV